MILVKGGRESATGYNRPEKYSCHHEAKERKAVCDFAVAAGRAERTHPDRTRTGSLMGEMVQPALREVDLPAGAGIRVQGCSGLWERELAASP